MRKVRFLIVEDTEDWRQLLVTSLKMAGFEAEAAANLGEARRCLANNLYHFLILDIRLDDSDDKNAGGMEFLEELAASGQNLATKVIMLSAYGTLEQERFAFRDFDALDFVDKRDFDNRGFVANIRNLLPQCRINLDLAVRWQGLDGPEAAVQGMRLQGQRLGRGSEHRQRLKRTGLELDDLLCRLFHEAEEVLVEPLAGGRGGGGVLLAHPSYSGRGGGQPLIVKFGDVGEIHQEAANYRRSVAGFIGGGRATRLEDERQTALLGGICYSLVGAGGRSFETWPDYYAHADKEQVQGALESLFLETCGNWYANASALELVDLSECYRKQLGFSPEALTTAFQRGLRSVQGKDKVRFNALAGDRRLTNPLKVLAAPPLQRMTYLCDSHGDLHPGNLIVDGHGSAWLIDFQHTGRGHILRDFAQLDTTSRFLLLKPEQATLDERLVLEEALAQPDRFSHLKGLEDSFTESNPEVAKIFATCLAIRRLAARQVERNPRDDMSEYHIACLYFALNWIRFYDNPRPLREHAFLSAAVLAERLGL